VRLFFHELRAEQTLYWRSREAAFFTFLFPILLYVLVSAFYTGKIDGQPAGRVLLAGLLGYGAATTTFAGIAIFLVIRRENGVLKRLRATPLPPAVYIAALLASTLLVFAAEAVARPADLAEQAMATVVQPALDTMRRRGTPYRGLLYAGTERGVWVSYDDCDRWSSLRLNLPATSVRR